MKQYLVTYTSKKTQHPRGNLQVNFLVEKPTGTKAKEAAKLSLMSASEFLGEPHQFKAPNAELITDENKEECILLASETQEFIDSRLGRELEQSEKTDIEEDQIHTEEIMGTEQKPHFDVILDKIKDCAFETLAKFDHCKCNLDQAIQTAYQAIIDLDERGVSFESADFQMISDHMITIVFGDFPKTYEHGLRIIIEKPRVFGLLLNDCEIELVEPEPINPAALKTQAFGTLAEKIQDLNEKIESLDIGEHLFIEDLENAAYHGAKGYSKSTLWAARKDPAYLDWIKAAPTASDQGGALSLGSACHTVLLEPEKFTAEYVIEPVFNKRTNQGKEDHAAFLAENCDKSIISKDDYEKINIMTDSVKAHPRAQDMLNAKYKEVSIFYKDKSGLVFKIRPDALSECKTKIYDFKTCADLGRVNYNIVDYGYHAQDGLYSYVMSQITKKQTNFQFVVVSSAKNCGRHPVEIFELPSEYSALGLSEISSSINNIVNYELGFFSADLTKNIPYLDRIIENKKQ